MRLWPFLECNSVPHLHWKLCAYSISNFSFRLDLSICRCKDICCITHSTTYVMRLEDASYMTINKWMFSNSRNSYIQPLPALRSRHTAFSAYSLSEGIRTVISGIFCVFSGKWTVLSGMYCIRDGVYRVFGMDRIHTGRYSKWVHV